MMLIYNDTLGINNIHGFSVFRFLVFVFLLFVAIMSGDIQALISNLDRGEIEIKVNLCCNNT